MRYCALFPISVALWLVFAVGLSGCGSTDSEFGKGQRDASIPSDGPVLTVFADGRAIVKGTQDPAVARSLYARYVGA